MFTIAELRKQFLEGVLTPKKLMEQILSDIKAKDENINAFIDVYDEALLEAEKATKQLAEEGEKSAPLLGIPWRLKIIF
jgi:Asp-tRNA(Asn)/Glu-tRNA(Gln) amidotransferase A subunit family amidase